MAGLNMMIRTKHMFKGIYIVHGAAVLCVHGTQGTECQVPFRRYFAVGILLIGSLFGSGYIQIRFAVSVNRRPAGVGGCGWAMRLCMSCERTYDLSH